MLEADLFARGVPRKWQAWADADAAGRYAMVVPLPTGWRTATVATSGSARIRAGSGEWRAVSIPERAVRGGERVIVDLVGR